MQEPTCTNPESAQRDTTDPEIETMITAEFGSEVTLSIDTAAEASAALNGCDGFINWDDVTDRPAVFYMDNLPHVSLDGSFSVNHLLALIWYIENDIHALREQAQ